MGVRPHDFDQFLSDVVNKTVFNRNVDWPNIEHLSVGQVDKINVDSALIRIGCVVEPSIHNSVWDSFYIHNRDLVDNLVRSFIVAAGLAYFGD